MNLNTLTQSLIDDTLASLPLFLPELILCGTILVMLLARLFPGTSRVAGFHWAIAGAAFALGVTVAGMGSEPSAPQGIFTQLLIYDSFTTFFRALLLFFVVLFCLMTRLSLLVAIDDETDFYALVLGATLGMLLMASANHLLIVFLAVEMASVPSYVLAGIMKGRRHSSEAALKYVVYGAGAAGVMLYGISLLSGLLGSAHLPTMAQQLAALDLPEQIADGTAGPTLRLLALGGLMILVGLAFKLSAVPFHFWCPDVFTGAAAEINAFLSVASKAAALALLVRVAIGFGFIPTWAAPVPEPVVTAGVFSVASEVSVTATDKLAALEPVRSFMVYLLALIAAVTCTFGNLAAFGQRNIKRMLAYSTIAHAGYMIMPVAAALATAVSAPDVAREAISSLTFYLVLYLFMNLGAFAVVAFLRNAIGSEEIADYAGLMRHSPALVLAFSAILVSLIGLPPLAGFWGKVTVFLALVKAGGPLMITLLVIAALNTALSLVYYLRVVKVMTVDPEPEFRGSVSLPLLPVTYVVAVTVPVLVFGIWWDAVYRFASQASIQLFS